MTGRTHLVGGFLSAEILLKASIQGDFGMPALSVFQAAVITSLCLFGSVFPDIDINSSKIGSTVKPLSTLINKTVGHRTLFHSPLLYGVLLFLSYRFLPESFLYMLGFTVGAFSHLALDFFNPVGISLFWPIPMRFWLFGVKTGTRNEVGVVGVLWTLIIVCGVQIAVSIFSSVLQGVM